MSMIVTVSAMCFLIKNVDLEGDKFPILKDRMINGILHLWSFLSKFMKLAKGLFPKFHMK